jgi:hypothetical protein
VNAALSLYALGLVVMLGAMVSNQVNGWVALGVWLVGLGVFSAGILVEERTHRT